MAYQTDRCCCTLESNKFGGTSAWDTGRFNGPCSNDCAPYDSLLICFFTLQWRLLRGSCSRGHLVGCFWLSQFGIITWHIWCSSGMIVIELIISGFNLLGNSPNVLEKSQVVIFQMNIIKAITWQLHEKLTQSMFRERFFFTKKFIAQRTIYGVRPITQHNILLGEILRYQVNHGLLRGQQCLLMMMTCCLLWLVID